MLKIFILILGVTKVLALKCHVCDNFDTALCLKIENSKNKLLKECAQNETRCALLIEKTTDLTITRKCVKTNWKCDYSKYNCKACESDGCNTGQEIDNSPIVNKTEVVNIIMANLYGISIIALLVSVALIWCLIRVCTKKREIQYEDEDDCDEYYENETNIDLDYPSDQKA